MRYSGFHSIRFLFTLVSIIKTTFFQDLDDVIANVVNDTKND